jgi:hypothetical protein
VEGLLRPLNPSDTVSESLSDVILHKLNSSIGLSRTHIAAVVGQAHGPHMMHLQPNDCLFVLNSIASTYLALHMERKRAYILREVSAVLVDLLVISREDASSTSLNGSVENVGLAITGLANGLHPSPRISLGPGTISSRPTVQTEGNDSVLSLVKGVCKVYGIDLTRISLVDALQESSGAEDRPTFDVTDEQDRFGWPELQMGVVREAVAIAEALPGKFIPVNIQTATNLHRSIDYPAVAQFSLSTLQCLRDQLAPSEQAHLHATAAKALATSRRRGRETRVDYWAGNPVYSVEIVP